MTENESEIEHETDDESRGSLAKKGALATGALALGAAGTNTVSAQDDGDGDALVFSYDFFPGGDFTVVSRLEQSTTVDVLQIDDETVSEISQPDEWSGHVIRYDMDGEGTAGVTTFLFLRDETLDTDDSGTLGEDAQMFSSDLNLLSSTLD